MYREPTLTKVPLSKEYKFMYENFVIATQAELYIMLEESVGIVSALKFDFLIYKYGYPNDEGLGIHPMAKFGLGWYEFYHVKNSIWISQMREQQPETDYDPFENTVHYIITFKDVTLDVVSRRYEEIKLTKMQIHDLITLELNNLSIE